MKWTLGAMLAIAAWLSAGQNKVDSSEPMVDADSAPPPARTAPASHSDRKRDRAADEATAEVSRDYVSGVIGGPHDFSSKLGGQANACAACHIPHIQKVQVVTRDADAESGDLSAPDDDVFLRLYRIEGQRSTFEPDRYTPGPASLICLGCHDGTLASSTIGSAHAMLAGVREGFNVPDGFVWRDHPIGVAYPSGNRDYRPFGQVVAGGQIRMPQQRVECVSCHDPHNAMRVDKMLVMSNRRSALCLSCHIK